MFKAPFVRLHKVLESSGRRCLAGCFMLCSSGLWMAASALFCPLCLSVPPVLFYIFSFFFLKFVFLSSMKPWPCTFPKSTLIALVLRFIELVCHHNG
ncbi:hypothetical protein ANANG_G00183000 [Anguilla anguilla]|uniref:Uncharacterized protein n=1 Tax=Anguilla anguilla TaxID=7936 RepID=A0A9D3M7C1_ANGAN|nr:hypothetical protein ANANG_G00183000 [Anguilla anguilla]